LTSIKDGWHELTGVGNDRQGQLQLGAMRSNLGLGKPQAERKANRWGSERGFCVVMGQKLSIERPRVRSTEDREIRLGSYEQFHRGEPLTETVWEKLMLGLRTRVRFHHHAVSEWIRGAVATAMEA
jgi:hypothetical protein